MPGEEDLPEGGRGDEPDESRARATGWDRGGTGEGKLEVLPAEARGRGRGTREEGQPVDSQAKDQVKVRREGCRGVQQAASTSTAEDEAGTLHLAGTSPPLRSASRVPLPLSTFFTSRSVLSLFAQPGLARAGGKDSGASRALLGRASPSFSHLSVPLSYLALQSLATGIPAATFRKTWNGAWRRVGCLGGDVTACAAVIGGAERVPCREAGSGCEQERHVLMAPAPQASAGDKLNSATVFIAINPEFSLIATFRYKKKCSR